MDLSVLALLGRLRSTPSQDEAPRLLERGIVDYQNKHYLKALEVWKKASALGNTEAQYRIGLLYSRGEGVIRNAPDGVAWFKRAAEAGHSDAQYQLGRIFLGGADAGPNQWFEAASQRDSES